MVTSWTRTAAQRVPVKVLLINLCDAEKVKAFSVDKTDCLYCFILLFFFSFSFDNIAHDQELKIGRVLFSFFDT